MTEARELKENDLWPPYTVIVEDAAGDRVNLSSAAIFSSAYMRDGTCVVSRSETAHSITFPTSGEFDYLWTGSETGVAGDYYLEWEIWLGNDPAKKMTIPRRPQDKAVVKVHPTTDDQ